LPIIQKCNITLTIISQNLGESSGLHLGVDDDMPIGTSFSLQSIEPFVPGIKNNLLKTLGKP